MSGNLLPSRDPRQSQPSGRPEPGADESLIDTGDLVERLRAKSADLALHWGGIAPAIESSGFHRLVEWIDAGYAGEMAYIENRKDAYRHPSGVLPGVRSIIVLAMPYSTASPAGIGRVARYAQAGNDYHDVIHPKLKQLCRIIADGVPGSHSRGVVDTAPLLEREIAQLAGFGWRGKNTLLLNKQMGSYFFLACVLTDVELPTDQPHESAHCGTCTACLDACPTAAFPQPGVLDATRCISYLTIENSGAIPVELRSGVGDWLFGCDVCQEVCPWNRKPVRTSKTEHHSLNDLDLASLFDLSDDEFRQRFRKTPLWRTRRRGVLRNAAIVIGNSRDRSFSAALEKGLTDPEPVVRGAAAWAIGQIGSRESAEHLKNRQRVETDATVQKDINDAIRHLE